MNYKDTILKQKQFKWNLPKMIITEDGKVDLDIHVPLTAIIQAQARQTAMLTIKVVTDQWVKMWKAGNIDIDEYGKFMKEYIKDEVNP